MRALAAAGHAPVTFARHSPRSAEVTGRHAHVIGDVGSIHDLVPAVSGCDGICHVAALVSIRRSPAEFDAVNVTGLRNVLEAARKSDVAKVVYTSSFLAHPPAGAARAIAANDYQRTKAAALGVARAADRARRAAGHRDAWRRLRAGPHQRRQPAGATVARSRRAPAAGPGRAGADVVLLVRRGRRARPRAGTGARGPRDRIRARRSERAAASRHSSGFARARAVPCRAGFPTRSRRCSAPSRKAGRP